MMLVGGFNNRRNTGKQDNGVGKNEYYQDDTTSFFDAEYDDGAAAAAAAKYGYEDAQPDYGYGDAVPDSAAASYYGYEDPDEDAVVSSRRPQSQQRLQSSAPRRSSLKTGTSYCDEAYMGVPARRRASIGGPAVVVSSSAAPAAATGTGRNETKPRRRRSIGFKDEVDEIRPSSAEEGYPTEDWMEQQEYEAIQRNNRKIIKHVRKGTDKQLCTRGLEGFLSSRQSEERAQAVRSVISEQNRQRERGVVDPSAIAERYRQANLDCKIEAAERAELDEADASKILAKERRTWLLQQQQQQQGRGHRDGPRRRMSMY
jgi:hypothetical protein